MDNADEVLEVANKLDERCKGPGLMQDRRVMAEAADTIRSLVSVLTTAQPTGRTTPRDPSPLPPPGIGVASSVGNPQEPGPDSAWEDPHPDDPHEGAEKHPEGGENLEYLEGESAADRARRRTGKKPVKS